MNMTAMVTLTKDEWMSTTMTMLSKMMRMMMLTTMLMMMG